MSELADIVNYVVSSLIGVFSLLVLLRFVFQLVKADFFNPISQGIVKITSPALKPLRRVIPGLAGLDIAALVLVIALNMLSIVITLLLAGQNFSSAIMLIAVVSVLKLFAALLNIASFCMLGSIILSFVAPMSQHPAAILLQQVAEPIFAPFRKLLPDMGGIDLSPIFAFLLLGVMTKLLAILAAQFGIPVGTMWLFVFIGV
ncbi:MAG: YggT family protein [Pseudomonadales bacterium]|nr:YggT family protein [Pseudomonadales bacterium]